jgi:hypothetical protein
MIVLPGTNPWAVAKVTSIVEIAPYESDEFPLAISEVVTALSVRALIKFLVGALIGTPIVDTLCIAPPGVTVKI